jgi:copper chaperone CopZ
MSELTLCITGMGCRRCVREVTARLRDVPGVHTVVADAASGTVRIGGSMTAADVLGALAATPYHAELVRTEPRQRPDSGHCEAR